MLIRYKTGKNGKPVPQANIYTAEEHGISPKAIDFDALKIARRLRRHGYQAYIVGGAVRDLLLGKPPNDFDMVTDASPNQIRKLFRNSRSIGKRFRLVHIFFQQKIIEVSTFRSRESSGFNAVYGDIEEDAERRDFTLNSLFFDPEQRQVIDYTGGYEDIQQKVVRPVIPLSRIFEEDPVRMIRAIKYTVQTGFCMTKKLQRRLQRSVGLLDSISSSRITEEVFKILSSGKAAEIIYQCYQYGLLPYMLPQIDTILRENAPGKNTPASSPPSVPPDSSPSLSSSEPLFDRFFRSLQRLDAEIAQKPDSPRALSIAYLFAEPFYSLSELGSRRRIPMGEAYTELKQLLKPVTPPNREVEDAVHLLSRRRREYLESGWFPQPPPHSREHPVERKQRSKRRRGGRGKPKTT